MKFGWGKVGLRQKRVAKPLVYELFVEAVSAEIHERVRLSTLSPKTRGDCLPGGHNEARPCRWRGCYWHMENAKASCVLDVADNGGTTLEEVGEILGVTRERVRQIEAVAVQKLLVRGGLRQWRER